MHLLIAGGDGQLGCEFPALATDETRITCCKRSDMDITDIDQVRRALQQHRPDAVINAAAYTAVDRAETEESAAFAINATGAGNLARATHECGIPLLHVSTDYVFAGDKPHGMAYAEDEPCAPQSAYGRSKHAGEQHVLAAHPGSLVLRTSWVFGRHGNNFPKTMLRLGQEREEMRVVADQWGGPTHANDIALVLLKAAHALQAGTLAAGIYHYAGQPFCSWHEFACAIFAVAQQAGLRVPARVVPIATHEYPVPARRPANSALDSRRICQALGVAPSDWQAGIRLLVDHVTIDASSERKQS